MQPDNAPELLPPKSSHWHRFINSIGGFRHWSRKRKILSLLLLLVVAGLGAKFLHHKHSVDQANAQAIAQASVKVTSPLTGEVVTAAEAARPVTGVMIENSTEARPQSGLQNAGVVFEAQAEGGITRFLALFQEARPSYIGPVRSLRSYYLDWADGFQASIAHVGGSPDALKRVRSPHGQRDLDEFFNASSYWRINSRWAPHNVYTSFDKLDALNKSKGYTKSSFTPWSRKDDSPSAMPTAKTINLTLSGYLYNVTYHWDAESDTYYRWEGGAKHLEVTSSGKQVQIHPKVVIAMIVPLSQGKLDASNAYYSNYHTLGRGRVIIFQDGRVIGANWSKKDAASSLTLTDDNGNPIKLNTGQTWITAITARSAASWSAK